MLLPTDFRNTSNSAVIFAYSLDDHFNNAFAITLGGLRFPNTTKAYDSVKRNISLSSLNNICRSALHIA